MTRPNRVRSPHDAALGELQQQLRANSHLLEGTEAWPHPQLQWCAEAGVFEWFIAEHLGGQGWNSADLCRGYLALSSACLTTTFVITQFMAASQRLAASDNTPLAERWVPAMIRGEILGTIAVSHLTTSRRHFVKPVLQAERMAGGYRLQGYSPWVTGGDRAQVIVTGAALEDGKQILVAVPTDAPGVVVGPPQRLLALAASHTGPVHYEGVEVRDDWLVSDPESEVMRRGTGGVQTSTLALGLAAAAVDYLTSEAERREDLRQPLEALRSEWQEAWADLLSIAEGHPLCSTEQIRARANSFVLRATHAAMVAAKGTGFVEGHPAGRWCREALFFLVWSCPQNVLNSNLCELAGIAD